MRIEIHRHRMAMSPNDDGRIAVGYDVLVPEEDVLPGAQGHIRIILSPGFREYRTYEDATWVTDLPRGFERYARWLDHEKAAQRQMLAMVQEHCPETRNWSEWPVFWAFVDPASSQDTVRFTIEHPKESTPEKTTSTQAGTPAA
ncbi:MAG: hypothetical protein OXG04_18730 [Acidobacteria bacterium]|nr:hypothetical protein [Acidobacteriota bacterium]